MASTRTKVIGTVTTSTILAVLLWFVNSINFDTQIDLNDIVCAGDFNEPCEAHFNITSTKFTYYLYNKEGVELNFIPGVRDSYTCKKDGRFRSLDRLDREEYPCGVGWREFDFKSPLTSRYKYVEKFQKGSKKEYKLVVFKFNPEDEIKWGGKITGEEFDPTFLPVFTYNITQICDTKTIKQEKEIFELRIEGQGVKEFYTDYVNSTVCTDFPDNLTCIKNITGVNRFTWVDKFYEVNKSVGTYIHLLNTSVNCRVKTLFVKNLEVNCPDNYRCDVIDNEFCGVNLYDGDKNFNYLDSDGRGWDGFCFKISELEEGRIKISNKPDYIEVKR